MSFRFTWHGEQLKQRWHDAGQKAIDAVTKEAVKLCREAVGEPYPPASLPGEPPHKRTGEGQRGIIVVPNPNSPIPQADLTVSRKAVHMIYLEYGTRLIRPRPWLKPTLIRNHKHLYDLGNQVYARELNH